MFQLYSRSNCWMAHIKVDLSQRVAETCSLTIYCHSCNMNQYIQGLYPTNSKRIKSSLPTDKSYVKLAPAARPFLPIFPGRIALHSQNWCSHLSCNWCISECQGIERQWHLEPRYTHQMPIINEIMLENMQVLISNSFIQGNKTSGHGATGACFSLFLFFFLF